ncbi:hypothetical protein [uncultured Methanofollis sp.]|uniref:hypothetical protein n=1 Tax=uncultured Methanofollis sp. TaxID=262500 RepID=UPI0026265194|nr:hypothetical protein [uncultured Methanofollis sp.]
MKFSEMNTTFQAAIVLLLAAVAALLLAALSNRGDLTTAMLVLAGFGCFVTAIFLLALSKRESLDPDVTALLPVQGTIAVATLVADLGVQGDALFFPPDEEGRVLEMIPAGSKVPSVVLPSSSYCMTPEGDAVVITPLCAPLLSHLRTHASFEVPDEKDHLCEAISEVIEDGLGLAGSASVQFDGENLVLDLTDFALIEGCRRVRAASPKCCTMVGCPVCGLIACIAAEGLGQSCKIASAMPAGDGLHLIIVPVA